MKSLSSKIKEKCNSATICIVAQHAKMNCLSSKIKQSSQRCTVMSSSLSKITENNSVAVFGVMRRLCFSNQVFDKSFILHGSWSQCPFRNSKDVGISEHKSCLGILLDDCGRNNIWHLVGFLFWMDFVGGSNGTNVFHDIHGWNSHKSWNIWIENCPEGVVGGWERRRAIITPTECIRPKRKRTYLGSRFFVTFAWFCYFCLRRSTNSRRRRFQNLRRLCFSNTKLKRWAHSQAESKKISPLLHFGFLHHLCFSKR